MRRKKSVTKASKISILDTPEKLVERSVVKEIIYKDPKVKVGNGKLGPVDLIIFKDDLYALKRIPKAAIDKPKRI
jgi:hypothetical protein